MTCESRDGRLNVPAAPFWPLRQLRILHNMRPQLASLFCLISVLLFLSMAGCGATEIEVVPEAPKVTVMHPQQRELSDHEEFNGWMAADKTVEVRARVRGHIQKVNFTDGQYVKKGDLLFELDPRPFEAEIGKSERQPESLGSAIDRGRKGGSTIAIAGNQGRGQHPAGGEGRGRSTGTRGAN